MKYAVIVAFIFLFSCINVKYDYYDINGEYIGFYSGSTLSLDTLSGEYYWTYWERKDTLLVTDYDYADSTFILQLNQLGVSLKYNPMSRKLSNHFPYVMNGSIINDTLKFSVYEGNIGGSDFQGVKQY